MLPHKLWNEVYSIKTQHVNNWKLYYNRSLFFITIPVIPLNYLISSLYVCIFIMFRHYSKQNIICIVSWVWNAVLMSIL